MNSCDVVCIGEAMAQVTPTDGNGVESAAQFQIDIAGAESNVAINLAQLEHRAVWFGRVGDDAFGRRVRNTLEAQGVIVHTGDPDATRPTGLFVKDPTPTGSTVTYYRAGSAASALAPHDIDDAFALHPRVLHTSGVTAALSTTAREAVEHALANAPDGIVTSFDVNYRPRLWPSKEHAAQTLLDLARQADIVFVGRDEAENLWGTRTAEECRALLPEVPHLVVKDGSVDAVEFDGATETRVPARVVEVVEAVGAGDAFASGWLHGYLHGDDSTVRLRLGHLIAGRVLTSLSDYTADRPDLAALRATATEATAATEATPATEATATTEEK